MRFALTDEQQMLRDAVRGVAARELGVAAVRGWIEQGDGRAPYAVAARQGWTGIGVSEDQGGQGGGPIELAILAEELGYVAVPGPHTAAALAREALRGAGDGAAELLAALAAGERTAVLAAPSGQPLGRDAGGQERRFVLSAPEADVLLVPGAAGLDAVAADDPAVQVEPLTTTDLTRRWAHVRIGAAAERRPLGGGAPADAAALALVLLAADSLGAAQRMLDMSVAYAREREQFERPIGSFQAVKHLAADMLVDVEASRSAVYYAAWSLGEGEPDAAQVAALAAAFCAPAGARVADAALALHGAIGFTWEHDLHLFSKRAKANVPLFGAAGVHLEAIAATLDLAPTA